MGILRHASGNFYINDKSMGSALGQRPFGGPGLWVGGPQWVGLQVGGSEWWGFKWRLEVGAWGVRRVVLQVGGAPLHKLSVVVPPVTANAAQTEI